VPGPPLDLSAVRDALPALRRAAYLNTGSAGPLPVVAGRAIERAVGEGLAAARGAMPAWTVATARHDALRAEVGGVLSAPASEIAIAGSSTHALDMALWGIDWREGDEVVTTNLEHPGLAVPLRLIAARRGVTVRMLDLGDGDVDLEREVGRVAGPRTRAVALSHVAWSTGALLDVESAARAAAAVGALVVVDGAQGVGAVPTDPRALGADAYAVPGHKWLLGPEGLGALWVRAESLERLGMTYGGYSSGTGHAQDGSFTPHPAARRLETSTLPDMLVPGWIASLAWLRELGWDWIHARVAEGAAAAREILEAIPGVRVVSPASRPSGLVAFTVAGADPEEADARLAREGVLGRWIPHPRALRVSVGFFTDRADLDRMGAAVALIASRR
jgi:L-cysteine/cystine lyase